METEVNVPLPIGVLDADWLLLLLLDVTFSDANKDADQEDQTQHAGADLQDFLVANDWR